MTTNSEMIADDNGIEILVGYKYEQGEGQLEECHGYHQVGALVYTELESVEVVIGGRGIDVLDRMTQKQKDHIVSKLNYD